MLNFMHLLTNLFRSAVQKNLDDRILLRFMEMSIKELMDVLKHRLGGRVERNNPVTNLLYYPLKCEWNCGTLFTQHHAERIRENH